MRKAGLVAALALVVALPAAGAWMSYGSQEPNSRYDREGGLMWQTGPAATDQVYFDVVTGLDAGTGYPGVSPNSATLGSRVESPATQADFAAMLGVWVDCNHDGYVGMADAALREYPAQISASAGHPIDTTICPDLADTPANAGRIHYSSASGWVTELIPIGVSTSSDGTRHRVDTDDRILSDLGAKVWGDHVEPVTHDLGTGSVACTTTFAAGGSRHTGGVLQHVDCLDGHAAPGDVAALYAEGGPADRAVPGLGDDDSGNAYVSGAQDCRQAPLVDLSSQMNNGGNPMPGQRGVRAPGTPTVNPNGNLAAQANETHEELFLTDDCRTDDDGGQDFYGPIESPGSDVVTNHVLKTVADMDFGFRPWNARWGCAGASGKALCGAPQDFGLPEAYDYQGTGGNLWTASSPSSLTLARPQVDRGSTPPTVAPNALPANWYTFYAEVTLSGVATPGAGTYGAEFCVDGMGPGAQPANGWDCDAADWNLVAGTTTPAGDKPWRGNVGDAYDLRDVDCYDSTLVAGVGPAGACG